MFKETVFDNLAVLQKRKQNFSVGNATTFTYLAFKTQKY